MRYPIAQARKIVEAGIPFGPRLHPCVCGCGQHTHAGARCTGTCRAAGCGCRRYRMDTAWDLAYRAIAAQNTTLGHSLRAYSQQKRAEHQAENPRQPGEWSLGPSDADACRRALWYRNLPPLDLVLAPTDHREARMGEIFHDEAVNRLRVLYPWQEFTQKIQVKGLDREGEYDRYDEVTAEVEDLKTGSNWVWDTVSVAGPFLAHWKQDALYGLGLEEKGRPVRTLRLTYIKRENGHDMTFSRSYDREFAEAARQELLAIATALDLLYAEQQALGDDTEWIDPGDALPRDRAGPSTDEICRRCPFRRHCWNLDEADAEGRSGESYTLLGPAPDATDEATIWAVQNAYEATTLASATEKTKKEAAALVTGLEPGRYGLRREWTVFTQEHGHKPRPKEYIEIVNAALALPEDQRPDLAAIPVPKGPSSIKTHVKPTRADILERELRALGEPPTLPKPEGGAA